MFESQVIMSEYIETTDETTRTYELTPEEPYCVYTTEIWTNFLSNGKKVTFLMTQYWRDGIFEIELTDKEKEAFLKEAENENNILTLNNYGCVAEEVSGGHDRCDEIQNESSYSEEEICEIKKLLFSVSDDDGNKVYDGSIDEIPFADTDILETNDWCLDDTMYMMTCDPVLEEIKIE